MGRQGPFFPPLLLIVFAAFILIAGCTGGGGLRSEETLEGTDTEDSGEAGTESEVHPGVIKVASNAYSFLENAGIVSIDVTRTGGTQGAVSVRYSATNGSAHAWSDFVVRQGERLSWEDGDGASKKIFILLRDNNENEWSKSFSISLAGAAGGASLGSPSSATVSIVDDDAAVTQGVLSFSDASSSAGEGSGAVTLYVRRSGGSTGEVTVDYATSDGTAAADQDYAATGGTLTWADGDAADKPIEVTIIDDLDIEGDQDFSVTLSNAAGGATVGAPAIATVTINDDDVAPPQPGALGLISSGYAVGEGGGTVTLFVGRIGGSDGAVTVDYATSDGTAAAGTDYTAASGTLSWSDGDTESKQIAVSIADDTDVEGDEVFSVTILNPTNGAALGGITLATVTIIDDDVLPPEYGALSLTSAGEMLNEGDGSITLYVQRIGGSDGAVTVGYATVDGMALDGTDYTGASGTLSWADGDAADKPITVTISDDPDVEEMEDFTVWIFNATGGATIAEPSQTAVWINDNDVMPPEPGIFSFASESYAVFENGATVTLYVQRTVGADGDVTVDYATSDGTAFAGEDYTGATGTLSWADQDTDPKPITVSVSDDPDVEGDEAFSVAITNATGGAWIDIPSTATVTINNDDTDPNQVSLSAGSYATDETSLEVCVTAVISHTTPGQVRVGYATTGGSAVAGEDYGLEGVMTEISGVITWASGESDERSICIPIIDDPDVEGDETFTFALTPLENTEVVLPDSALITIGSDDVPPPEYGSLFLIGDGSSVGEADGTITLFVERIGGADGAVTVDYATADGSALNAFDYSWTSGTLSWADQDVDPKPITVTIYDDPDVEGDEDFSVAISNATGGATVGAPSSATVWISDDDALLPEYGSLSFEASDYGDFESTGSITLYVQRTGGSDGAVTVDYASSDGTAFAGEDYTAASGTLTWADGDMASQPITVSVSDDPDEEGEENFFVTLSNATGGAGIAEPSIATATISNDDVAEPNSVYMDSDVFSLGEASLEQCITVYLNRMTGGQVSVGYATYDGTATAALFDYTQTSGTFIWPDGNSDAQQFCIPISDDTEIEGNETFGVSLSALENVQTTWPDWAEITIIDDD